MKRFRSSYLYFVLLVVLCAVLIFTVVASSVKTFYSFRTDHMATLFDDYARYENGEVVYLSREACFADYRTTFPNEQNKTADKTYAEYYGEGDMVRLTHAATRCEDPSGRHGDGVYYLEAWVDFLEIPTSRQKDRISLRFSQDTTYLTEDAVMVIRYKLVGDDHIYEKIKKDDIVYLDLELPKGDLESLQIYLSHYVVRQHPDFSGHSNVWIEYWHTYGKEREKRYYNYYHIHYIPRENLQKEEAEA